MRFSTVHVLKSKLNRRIRDKYKMRTFLQRKYYKKVLRRLKSLHHDNFCHISLFGIIIKKIDKNKHIKRNYTLFLRRLKYNDRTYGFGWHIFRRSDVKNDVNQFIYFMNNYVSKENTYERELRNIQRTMLNPGPKIDSHMRKKLIDTIYRACLIETKNRSRVWNEFQKYLKFKPTKNTLNSLIQFLINRCNATQRQNYCKLQFQEMNNLRRIQQNLNQPQIKNDKMYPDILLQILKTMTMSVKNTCNIDVLLQYLKSFHRNTGDRLSAFRQKIFK